VLVLSEYKHSGYHKMSEKYNKLLLKYINYYLRNKSEQKICPDKFSWWKHDRFYLLWFRRIYA